MDADRLRAASDWTVPGPRPVLLTFLRITNLRRARRFFENGLGLRVLEESRKPPHAHHGIVKYDAGSTVLALSLNDDRAFKKVGWDGARIHVGVPRPDEVADRLDADGYVVDASEASCTVDVVDDYGRCFTVYPSPQPYIEAIELYVDDIAEAETFYREVLGMPRMGGNPGECDVGAGRVTLRLRRGKVPQRTLGFVLALHSSDVRATHQLLQERGVTLYGNPVQTDIGWAVQFSDPFGHRMCLYEPSDEALGWESGPKIAELMRQRVSR